MNFRISTYSFLGLFVVVCFFSCSNSEETTNQSNKALSPAIIETTEPPPTPPVISTQSLEVKTFEVIDETTKKVTGWGYDIYVDGKLNIHQPILPGVPGNQSFQSEESAKKVGMFALNKIKQTGGLPTITIKELDSLGVTK